GGTPWGASLFCRHQCNAWTWTEQMPLILSVRNARERSTLRTADHHRSCPCLMHQWSGSTSCRTDCIRLQLTTSSCCTDTLPAHSTPHKKPAPPSHHGFRYDYPSGSSPRHPHSRPSKHQATDNQTINGTYAWA